MAYIYPAPGVSGVQATLSIDVAANGSDAGLSVPALQDVTVNNANDVFTWTQLDATAKKTNCYHINKQSCDEHCLRSNCLFWRHVRFRYQQCYILWYF